MKGAPSKSVFQMQPAFFIPSPHPALHPPCEGKAKKEGKEEEEKKESSKPQYKDLKYKEKKEKTNTSQRSKQ